MPESGDKPKPRSTFAAHPQASAATGAERHASAADELHTSQASDAQSHTSGSAKEDAPLYTVGEEIANAVTHGLGAMLSVAALVLLIVKAVADGGGIAIASAIVFGISLILEYSASTLYHAITYPPVKRVLRIIDHSCIYLLIAGSYTPFVLGPLLPHGGLVIFAIVWVMAIAGITAELFMRERQPRWLTVTIYLVMGWLVVFQLPTIISVLELPCLVLLASGGLCYTVGTAFYLLKRVRYMHSVWHLWVLAGSVCQFLAVILFVI